ncbi:DeoR/GlpR family DNA-binding transcription regulator [Aurantimonas sp. VKM B-3413]|uniref:DeoR/GlpR family DNA-binding transcription regulator n=1 Tax=Aurantimonas sp. VKM B-3413 TaxID=2779401 RepID=UPI001E51271A|nr:DeoR/GlpR family DNA-binding transcription regulator [Aurantimonas sp. VKM B-3413]
MTTSATTAPLLTRQRQDLIRQRLERDGRVLAGPLAQELAVSEDTIRRDLRELAALGACERVYGGAVRRAPKAGLMADRVLAQTEEKSRLGKTVAGLIEPGETVFIDAGSTNVAVAAALPHGARLTVVTNSPAVASAVPPDAGIEIVLLGGRFDPRLGACLGARTLREAGRLRPDVMIIGACGIDPVAGITASEVEEAELKLALATASHQVMVAATADKLGTAAPFAIIAADRLNRLVVEAHADPVLVSAFEDKGVRVSRVSG